MPQIMSVSSVPSGMHSLVQGDDLIDESSDDCNDGFSQMLHRTDSTDSKVMTSNLTT